MYVLRTECARSSNVINVSGTMLIDRSKLVLCFVHQKCSCCVYGEMHYINIICYYAYFLFSENEPFFLQSHSAYTLHKKMGKYGCTFFKAVFNAFY